MAKLSEAYEVFIPYVNRKAAYDAASKLLSNGFARAEVRKVNPDAHPE